MVPTDPTSQEDVPNLPPTLWLMDTGCGHDLIRRLVEELESCDFARFSSAGGSREEMQACLKRARGLLAELERVPVAEEAAA